MVMRTNIWRQLMNACTVRNREENVNQQQLVTKWLVDGRYVSSDILNDVRRFFKYTSQVETISDVEAMCKVRIKEFARWRLNESVSKDIYMIVNTDEVHIGSGLHQLAEDIIADSDMPFVTNELAMNFLYCIIADLLFISSRLSFNLRAQIALKIIGLPIHFREWYAAVYQHLNDVS